MGKEKCCESEKINGNERLLICMAMLFLAISTGAGTVGYYYVGEWNLFSKLFAVAAVFSWGFYKNPKVALRVCIVLAITSAVIGGILIVYLAGVYPVKDSGQVASWVQAIGSLLALFGVIWATDKQAKTTIKAIQHGQLIKEQAQTEVVLSRIGMANALARKTYEKITTAKTEGERHCIWVPLNVANHLAAADSIQFMRVTFKNLKDTPLDQIKSGVLLSKVIEFNLHFEAVIKSLEAYEAGPRNRPDFQQIVNATAERDESKTVEMLYEGMLSNLEKRLIEIDALAASLAQQQLAS
ncbi:hypothetical protein E4695_08645 [Alcaligenaceae bacterium 429]|nr:hypothetical protein E4695_08645 [Alcaligenaceae bacterium 429]